MRKIKPPGIDAALKNALFGKKKKKKNCDLDQKCQKQCLARKIQPPPVLLNNPSALLSIEPNKEQFALILCFK